MIDINELSDVEIEQYVKESFGHTEEYKETKKKNVLIKRIDTTIKSVNALNTELRFLSDIIKYDEYEKASSIGRAALAKANRCAGSVRNITMELGIPEEEDSSTEHVHQELILSGEAQNGILRIEIPELLPDKVKQWESGEYNRIYHKYLPAFQNFFSKGRFPIYESKAVICIYSYYENETQLKDHDNFEVKPIIDILSAFLLPDDSPKWCANFMDYRMGEKCYTEIYVVPYSIFGDFFENNKVDAR